MGGGEIMRVIGLTGGIASGKSTVSAYLAQKGVKIIDADGISRDLSVQGKPGYEAIVREFGNGFLNADGSINRRELGKLVFSDAAMLAKLEGLLHPLIEKEILNEMEGAAGPVVIDAPLLHKAGLDKLCSEVWVVTAPDDKRIGRILARDGITEREARERIQSQIPQAELEKIADVVLRNNGEQDELYRQIDEVLYG
jgi:dephospho-CoA kinase